MSGLLPVFFVFKWEYLRSRARNIRASVNWLGDSAWTVSNGQSRGLSDRICLGAVGDSGGGRAVGGVSGHNLRGVDNSVVLESGGRGRKSRNGKDSGEMHDERGIDCGNLDY